jgi:hypothetical protein
MTLIVGSVICRGLTRSVREGGRQTLAAVSGTARMMPRLSET